MFDKTSMFRCAHVLCVRVCVYVMLLFLSLYTETGVSKRMNEVLKNADVDIAIGQSR